MQTPEVNRIAELLLDAWKKADPKSSVALHSTSYVATFADMAKVIIEDRNTRPVVPVTTLEAKLEASEKARDDAITHRLKANNDWRVAYEKLEAEVAEFKKPVNDAEVNEALKGLLNPVVKTTHPVADRVIRKLYSRQKGLELKLADAIDALRPFAKLSAELAFPKTRIFLQLFIAPDDDDDKTVENYGPYFRHAKAVVEGKP